MIKRWLLILSAFAALAAAIVGAPFAAKKQSQTIPDAYTTICGDGYSGTKEEWIEQLDFNILQDGFRLYKLALDELYESETAFHAEFDKIISEYCSKAVSEEFSQKELRLMTETNIKLEELYSKYIKNQDVWDMLKQISSKKIKR